MSEIPGFSSKRIDRYLEKVEKIEGRTSDIRGWLKGIDETGFEKDKKPRLAVYKAFQETFKAVADLCAMYAADTEKSVGDDYENMCKASGELYREG